MHILLTFDHVKEKEMQLNLYNEPAILMLTFSFTFWIGRFGHRRSKL